MREATCAGCLYYHAEYNNAGDCRRYPPKHESGLSKVVVTPDYWCGEWRAAPVAKRPLVPKDLDGRVRHRFVVLEDGRIQESHSNLVKPRKLPVLEAKPGKPMRG